MGISVLMSVYAKERPEYFKAALESVINQSLQPDEILIIKDGPLTTELEQVIQDAETKLGQACNAGKPVLRTYQFTENVKLGRALAKGVELCQNELIARMDTDDIACPDRLEKQYAYMASHKEVAALGGYMEEFCDAKQNVENVSDTVGQIVDIKTMPAGTEAVRSYARYRNPLNHMTVMLRRSAILEVGNYRHYPFLEDYDLWGRVLAAGYTIDNLPEVLVRARVGNELYGRRGGWDYCKRYLGLRKEQHRLGLTNGIEWLIACAITIAVTIIPSGARKQVYQKILRK